METSLRIALRQEFLFNECCRNGPRVPHKDKHIVVKPRIEEIPSARKVLVEIVDARRDPGSADDIDSVSPDLGKFDLAPPPVIPESHPVPARLELHRRM